VPYIPKNSAALQLHISNIVTLIAKAAGVTFLLPKSGGDRPACLTVADCGQIAGFGENLRRWMRAIVVERSEL